MRRSWLWFFGILVLLAVAAIIIPIVHNQRMQLTPQQLAHARALWQEKGTDNYDLSYSERTDREPEADEFRVKVRRGRVVALSCNGQVIRFDDVAGLVLGPVTRSLPLRDLSDCTVEGLFNLIEANLKEDEQATGRRNYATAWFDSRDGHPVRYVHRNLTTKKRQELYIKLTREAR